MTLRIGLDIVDLSRRVQHRPQAAALADILAAERQGFDTAWVPQLQEGPDPLLTCALAAQPTSAIRLATGVLRVWGHHPVEMARAAVDASVASSGRFVLGVGVSHRHIVEKTYGIRFARPAAYLREYVTVLRALIHHGHASFQGEMLEAHTSLDVSESLGVLLAIAAGGPLMLAVAGELADIAITTMAGPRTVSEYTMPTLTQAADRVGRATPMLACAVSVCLSGDRDDATRHIDHVLASYAAIPDYRSMLEREGASKPSELAIVGDEADVTAGLARYQEAGAMEVIASVKAATPDEEGRTRDFLGELATSIRARAGQRISERSESG